MTKLEKDLARRVKDLSNTGLQNIIDPVYGWGDMLRAAARTELRERGLTPDAVPVEPIAR